MKLVMVGPFPFDTKKVTGGVEAVFLYLIRGLQKIDGLSIEIININNYFSKPETIVTDGIKVHYLPFSKYLGNLTLLAKNRYLIRKKIREIKPDIIHFQDYYAYICSKPFCPTVTTYHGIQHREVLFEKNGLISKVRSFMRIVTENIVLNKNKNIISISPYATNEIKQKSKANIYIIPNPVDDRFFRIPNNEIKNRLLCLVPIYRLKNAIDLIKAVEILKETIPGIELHIGGNIKDQNYFEIMIAYINDNNLGKFVKYLGHLPEDEVIKEYKECSLLVLPSLQENSPMVIQQAMAAGKPVVANEVGGMPYLVKDGITGFLVKCEDIENMAEKIRLLLSNKRLRDKFGKTARHEASKIFKSEFVAESTYNVYQKILKNKNC